MSESTLDLPRRRTLAAGLRARRDALARTVTDAFLRHHPEWTERYGDLARVRGEEDAAFHLDFLAGAVVSGDPSSFEEYARWTAGMLSARGIGPRFLAENLRQVGEAAGDGLDDEERALVDRMVAAGVRAVEEAAEDRGPVGDGSDPLATERSLYVQAIRSGQRRAALAIAMEASRSGVPVPRIYGEILQPAQYEMGRLWERNEISVATEHMATAITQYVVSQLYSALEIPDPVRGRAIMTGVKGELHQLGANMVADVLEADGWDMRFLGTQLPHAGVIEAIGEFRPRLVGISATVLSNLPAVADLVGEIRQTLEGDVLILVGGGAFRSSPDTWREIGADGSARDLGDAVRTAARLDAGTRTDGS